MDGNRIEYYYWKSWKGYWYYKLYKVKPNTNKNGHKWCLEAYATHQDKHYKNYYPCRKHLDGTFCKPITKLHRIFYEYPGFIY